MRVYTDGQLERYLRHIGFEPADAPHVRVLAQTNVVSETTLTMLQRLQMARVPFETAAVHYSTGSNVSLDPQRLFDKIVVQGRGGIRFELNTFFAAVLRSLDYEVYSAGARLSLIGLAEGGKPRHGPWFVPLPFPWPLCLVPIEYCR